MKYEKVNSVFNLKTKTLVLWDVVPFNGETEKYLYKGNLINDVGWSHGITQYKSTSGTYMGFCGIDYFEDNAEEIL